MGNMVSGVLESLLGWMQSLVNNIWGSLSGARVGGSLIGWLADNWLHILIILLLIGIVSDWLIWMVRWRPYWAWFRKKRMILDDDILHDETDDDSGFLAPLRAPRFHGTKTRASAIGSQPESLWNDEDDLFMEDSMFTVNTADGLRESIARKNGNAAKPTQHPATAARAALLREEREKAAAATDDDLFAVHDSAAEDADAAYRPDQTRHTARTAHPRYSFDSDGTDDSDAARAPEETPASAAQKRYRDSHGDSQG